MNESNGWSAYEKLVMAKLGTLEEEIVALDEKVTLLRIDVAQLKVKAGLWGAAAGMLPAVVVSLVAYTQGGL